MCPAKEYSAPFCDTIVAGFSALDRNIVIYPAKMIHQLPHRQYLKRKVPKLRYYVQ